MRLARATLGVLVLAACDGGDPPRDSGRQDAGALPDGGAPIDAPAILDAGPPVPMTVGPAERPARLVIPPAHDGATELPLVVLLHGHSVDSALQDLYFSMSRTARDDGFYLLLPDGTLDADGQRYWDVTGLAVDDHAYLRALIEETVALLPVAAGAIFALGHSNGGFMAYRLACDSADLVAGIASLAGSDAIAACAPAEVVSVLQIHGTADTRIPYDGGEVAGLVYPSAPEVVRTWAMRAACDPEAAETLAPRDVDAVLVGAETSVLAYQSGCTAPASVELWTIDGGEHLPALASGFAHEVVVWLRARAR